ncbi:MAG: hypothetical protein GXO92_05525 [FCB group bacterium]|nr:hypothetical protein [FCB group bacterium]
MGKAYQIIAELPDEGDDFDFVWEITDQPDASLLSVHDLEFSGDSSEVTFIPDAEGKYTFQVSIFQYGDELSTQSFTFNILPGEENTEESYAGEKERSGEDTLAGKVPVAGEEEWLNEEIEEDTEPLSESVTIETPKPAVKTITEEAAAKATKPVVKSKPVPKKPVPGASIPYDKNRFTIQVAAKKTLKDAEVVAAELIEAGFDAYIQKAYFKETDDLWYRVRVGSYENRETAAAVAKAIAKFRNAPTWVDFVRLENQTKTNR